MTHSLGYDKRDYLLPSEEAIVATEEAMVRKKMTKNLIESRKQMENCAEEILNSLRQQRDEMYVPIFDENLTLTSVQAYIRRAVR